MKNGKKILNSAIILTLVTIMMACGSRENTVANLIATGDMEAIRAKRKALSDQQKSLEQEIAKLDAFLNDNTENKNIPLVTSLTLKNQRFEHFVELQGDVTTRQNLLIYPEVSGSLISVKVVDGQKVKKNEVLAVIDDGGLRNLLLQLKTQLALAKTTFERQENLWKQEIGSEIQYLQAKANYESQENAVKQTEEQIAKYVIRAPFSGIIDEVIKDQGTVVAPGGPGSEVFRIVNLSEMYLEVDVPEAYLPSIVPGKEVIVDFPVLSETVNSQVRQTGNFINPNNRSFTAEIPVPNHSGKIKPNLTAKVKINDYTNDEAILIPQSIISENAEGEQYVYLATDTDDKGLAKARKQIIKTGKTQGDIVEVLEGIKNGQQVIVEGARSVKDNQEIKILKS